MPLYAGKYAICAFLQNMRNMLRSHDRYKPVSVHNDADSTCCMRRASCTQVLKSQNDEIHTWRTDRMV